MRARRSTWLILKIWKKFDYFIRISPENVLYMLTRLIVLSNSPFISYTRIWFHERMIAFWVSIEDIFSKKDEASQIFVQIWCMLAKHWGRISMGQTAKISPRSMVQTQQIPWYCPWVVKNSTYNRNLSSNFCCCAFKSMK